MALFTVGRRAFEALQSALGMTQTGAVLTKIELGHATAVYPLDAVIQAGLVTQRLMIRSRADVGAVNGLVDLRPHVADWTNIKINGVNKTPVADFIVPAGHDAWVIGAAGFTDTDSAFSRMTIFRHESGLVLGDLRSLLWFTSDTIDGQAILTSTSRNPFMAPLPWYVPPPSISSNELQGQLVTLAATQSEYILEVLSAPRGVLRMLP